MSPNSSRLVLSQEPRQLRRALNPNKLHQPLRLEEVMIRVLEARNDRLQTNPQNHESAQHLQSNTAIANPT